VKTRVLLVEDNRADARWVGELLKETAANQFEITWAKTRTEAETELGNQAFDAVLLDLGLPDSLGMETLWVLNPKSIDSAIVVLTGSADDELPAQALQAGAQDYLVKGAFDGAQLVRTMRYAIERRRIDMALQQTVRELERKTKELEEFTYSVSHDLKEPLRTLGAFSSFLLEDYGDELDDRGKEYLDTLAQASSRMKSLVEDLLVLSRLRQMTPEQNTVDMTSVLMKVLQNLQVSIEDRHASVILDTPLPSVLGDATRIGQIFTNLIGNALKFNQKEHPTVRVGQQTGAGGEATLYVTDDGIGIEPQYQDRVFGVFQRLHTREEYEGTGAGLAIVKHAVESMGGRIWVESELGQGATFYFSLPAVQVQVDALSAAA
jgi:signal transduction histidine kinase